MQWLFLAGTQQNENGFESIFFLIDTLEAHKTEKQKLPMAGNKDILNQNYDLVYKMKLHQKDTWLSQQVIFSMLCQCSNI